MFTSAEMSRNNGQRNHILDGHIECVSSVTLSSGVYQLPLNYGITSLTSSLSAVHRFYRFTDVVVEIIPASYSGLTMVQYVPGGGSTTPGPADGTLESLRATGLTAAQAVPARLHIPRKLLITNQPWFVCQGDATDPYLDDMGYLNFEGTATDAIYIRIVVDYEFKNPMPTELGVVADLQRLRRENKLLKQTIIDVNSCDPAKRSI